ncbi:MAG: hypothetical protein V4542_00555 [Pseudomonadota bacterium]
MRINDFFKASLKIAIAIFLAAVALSLVWLIGWKVIDYRDKEAAKQYEVVKRWTVDLRENLQMQVNARTKVVDSTLLATVSFDGYPEFLTNSRLAFKNREASFTLNFADQDGFKLQEKVIPLKQMTTTVDASGKKIGLEYQYSEFTPVDTYKRFAALSVQWNLETQSPVVPSLDFAPTDRPLDHCGPGLSKVERLKRLALSGSLRETGMNSYSAGNKSISFGYDGAVIYCN